MTSIDGNTVPTTEVLLPPSSPLVFTAHFHRRRSRNRLLLAEGSPPVPRQPAVRPARVAVMLAFAHMLEQAIHDGIVRDRVHAAQLLGLTRARVTQILNLLLLAPDIQAEILGLQTTAGREPVVEGNMRPLTAPAEWSRQRALWRGIRSGLWPL